MKNAPTGKASESVKVQHHSTKTTATRDQQICTLKMLTAGPQTSQDMRRAGIFWPAARIMELRRMGCKIVTMRRTVQDDFGHTHARMGQYVLLACPPEVREVLA